VKNKARYDNLVEIEKMYMLLQEKELLQARRRLRLVDFVEKREAKCCIHSSRLHELASEDILNPVFSVTDAVALTEANSGTVRVLATGSELDLSSPMTLSGVICAVVSPGSTDIRDVSLFWSSTALVQ
jgi:hypothetical protein